MNKILEISKKFGLTHVGSSLTAYPIIREIYQTKKPDEKFVCSSGHAHLAHLVVMEEHGLVNAEKEIQRDSHCNREAGCDASTGALGHGIGIAVGMALADLDKNVYCLISDGECAEGSVWEALRIAYEQSLHNLRVYVNANGFSAYDPINRFNLEQRLNAFYPVKFVRTKGEPPFDELKGHYAKVP